MPERDGERQSGPIERQGRVSRRRLLRFVGGGALAASVARVAYELTGFGVVTGTNVTEQALGPLVRRRLEPSPFAVTASGRRLAFDGESVTVSTAAGDPLTTVPVVGGDPDEVASRGAEHGLGDQLAKFATDLADLAAGDVSVVVSGPEAFFDRVEREAGRPLTVAALRGRGYDPPDPETLREFTGSDPSDPAALVTGLAEGFAERTRFDTARYVRNNVRDHLLFDDVGLRPPYEESTTFEAIGDGPAGLWCWEYVLRSVEAFHAVAPHRQSAPVFGAVVSDSRHNHAYSGLASVVRENGELHVPMTLLDYTHATMYENYRLDHALGSGVDAYSERHRISNVHYRNVYGY